MFPVPHTFHFFSDSLLRSASPLDSLPLLPPIRRHLPSYVLLPTDGDIHLLHPSDTRLRPIAAASTASSYAALLYRGDLSLLPANGAESREGIHFLQPRRYPLNLL